MMFNTFGNWSNMIPESSLEKTIDYVVTGGKIENVNVSNELLDLIDFDHSKKILDFGCGVGRNIIPLALKYPHIDFYAYDNPKMLNQMALFCEKKYNIQLQNLSNIIVLTDWAMVKTQIYDYVYATLVLQHIAEEYLNIYLQDIKNITHNLIVHGRRFNDDSYKNTWEIIEKNQLYPINTETYKTHGDLHEHQVGIYQFQIP